MSAEATIERKLAFAHGCVGGVWGGDIMRVRLFVATREEVAAREIEAEIGNRVSLRRIVRILRDDGWEERVTSRGRFFRWPQGRRRRCAVCQDVGFVSRRRLYHAATETLPCPECGPPHAPEHRTELSLSQRLERWAGVEDIDLTEFADALRADLRLAAAMLRGATQ